MSAELYTVELGKAVCRRIATSLDSLKTIGKSEGMPSEFTLRGWLIDYPEFRESYDAAKAAQQDLIADENREIAYAADAGDWQVAKLKIENNRWLASKLAPKRYGDKVTHASDPDAPLVTNPSADALIAFLLAKGATEHEIRAFIAAPNVIEHNPTKDKV